MLWKQHLKKCLGLKNEKKINSKMVEMNFPTIFRNIRFLHCDCNSEEGSTCNPQAIHHMCF